MLIDFHYHSGQRSIKPEDLANPITWEEGIARFVERGVDKVVMLAGSAAGTPESTFNAHFLYYPGTSIRDQVLKAKEYPDRIIPFGNLDVRWMGNEPDADFGPLLDWFQEQGCLGIGEITSNVPIDDPRTVNMFRQIGDRGLPALIHNVGYLPGTYGLQDHPGAIGLARLLREAPQTTVIGHGQGFWAEIGAGLTVEEKMRYPKGPIAEEGALPRLLRQYPNLYGDISAGSGHNALSRDPDYGVRFINEFQDRLLFGTDESFGRPELRMPHHDFLKELLSQGKITREAFEKITYKNALRVLGLEK
ncbi:MAG: amidohydrolase family protein [Anaerolineae bacterium]|nr:amidohydrolase family protein [Anaerolineae bacterium]